MATTPYGKAEFDCKAAASDSQRPAPAGTCVLKADEIRKTYGPTTAVNDVSIMIEPGEVVALVGANGAGKSTLMRVLSGVTKPDTGALTVAGKDINWDSYSPLVAQKLGIRVVYQELSLCTNLTVYENFLVEQPQRFRSFFGWRNMAREVAKEALDAVFPGNTISVNARLDLLTIAQRQMVEIARAMSDPGLKLLILDEPTSSLDAEQTEQLREYIKSRSKSGVSFIFISHRLHEVLSLADRIYVMRNGVLVWSGLVSETNEADLIRKMSEGQAGETEKVVPEPIEQKGTDRREATAAAATVTAIAGRRAAISVENLNTRKLHNINFSLKAGEIVGIAGLEGNGQRDLLRTLFHPSSKESKAIKRTGTVAYITGDRKKEGIFHLWSVARNIEISRLAGGKLFKPINVRSVNSEVAEWYQRLKIVGSGVDASIMSLSGGNQQKVLIARALIADADIIILDDPTRGVDIATKKYLYGLFQEAANSGKLVVWYSTDDEEFGICSRVFVLRNGKIVKELAKGETAKDSIINASFSGGAAAGVEKVASRDRGLAGAAKRHGLESVGMPLISMLLVYVISGLLSPSVFSGFGIDLLLSGAVPLVFASLGQMFAVGLSQVDLGVGAFMGLVNVISATILRQSLPAGAACLLLGLLIYVGMGALIYLRNIPAIIVTLGGSFIWAGIAYTLQSMPGGQAPEWLMVLFSIRTPVVPEIVYIVVLATLLAYIIHRSRYGTVLRGFGNNPLSMIRSGWSAVRAYSTSYAIAGLFGILGGLCVTAITTASDANATASLTLLSVAAVVMGGGHLTGGVVTPLGTVFGAITLSLIGALLGFLNVSADYVTAVQGAILLVVLGLRLLRKDEEQ